MKEYIEREQAIALFYPVDPENDGSDGCTIVYKSGNFSSSEIETMLSDLPAVDVAEVVRCQECKYKDECIRRIEFIGRNPVLEQNTYEYHPLEFCSYGQRKEDDHD